VRAVLTDVRPLQVSPAYRRLFLGNLVAQLGQQVAVVTIALQVYDLTGSSLMVGLVGVFGLVPLVAFGLYGGAVADAMDRRALALAASGGAWVVSLVLAAQAFLDVGSVWLVYGCVAVHAVCFAANSPARNAMVARLLPADLLPAASALNMATFNLGFTVGPLLGALLVSWGGFEAAYTVDALTFTATLYALLRLPAMPPAENSPRPGLRAVLDGLRFLRSSPNLRMTFVLDLCAMVLAHPRAIFPALAYKVLGGGAATVGVLQAAPAVGGLLAFVVSGWVSRVRLQGLAIVLAVVGYGLAISAVGLASALWVAVLFLVLAGAADVVSAAFRSTILQVAAPDELRGRLQGVFIVVVAGGPRAGDFLVGSLGEATSERLALGLGGIACVAGVLVAVTLQRGFLRYDGRHPTP
jgi:MFS family permease